MELIDYDWLIILLDGNRFADTILLLLSAKGQGYKLRNICIGLDNGADLHSS